MAIKFTNINTPKFSMRHYQEFAILIGENYGELHETLTPILMDFFKKDNKKFNKLTFLNKIKSIKHHSDRHRMAKAMLEAIEYYENSNNPPNGS